MRAGELKLALVVVAMVIAGHAMADTCQTLEIEAISDGGGMVTMTTGEVYRVREADRAIVAAWEPHKPVVACSSDDYWQTLASGDGSKRAKATREF